LQPDGDDVSDTRTTRPNSAPRGVADVSAIDALKTLAFWCLAFSMLARVGTQSTMMVHFIPLMVWKGITQEHAALLLSIFAGLNLITHFVLGWIADRTNKPKLLSLWMFLPIAGIIILRTGDSLLSLWLFTIFFSTLDAAFPVTWATSGDFFGRKHFATIRGNMTFFYMWGSALGPVIAGYLYDQTQSYGAILWAIVVTLSVSVLLTSLLIKPWTIKVGQLSAAPLSSPRS
jgi:fucose permease